MNPEMRVSLELLRGTRVTPALRTVREVGGLYGADTINSAKNENAVIALDGIGLNLCKVDADLSFVRSC